MTTQTEEMKIRLTKLASIQADHERDRIEIATLKMERNQAFRDRDVFRSHLANFMFGIPPGFSPLPPTHL